MSKNALYTKYRSKSLSEVIGQEHIVEVLKNTVKLNKISHAYLFTGPHGIGKTSIARIFAHQINNIDYTPGKTHLDIIEIDAASNSGVDDMRNLREKITSAPSSLKFKIYIIDEVHMLSPASFAALLKTIEEPPSHTVFILATTDSHKIPVTIMSRVQKFFFKPIDSKLITSHLKNISKQEGIKYQDEALSLIAENASGSMRDALSLLDQISSSGKTVDIPLVQSSLGLGSNSEVTNIKDSILNGDQESTITNLNLAIQNGADPKSLATQIYQELKLKLSNLEELNILGDLLTIGSLTKPLLGLELSLIKLSKLIGGSNPNQAEKPTRAIQSKVESDLEGDSVISKPTKDLNIKESKSKKSSSKKITEDTKPNVQKDSTKTNPEEDSKSDLILINSKDFNQTWDELLLSLSKKNPSYRAILKNSKTKFTNTTYTLEISSGFPTHLKTLQSSKCKQSLLETFNEAKLKAPQIKFSLADKPRKVSSPKSTPRDKAEQSGQTKEDFSAIMNLMGGGELLPT